MVTKNEITGDKIQTKPTTKEYSDNWDRIFGKKDKFKELQEEFARIDAYFPIPEISLNKEKETK